MKDIPMTIAINDLTYKFKTKLWIIPDKLPPGVIPPTIDEMKQMYLDDILIMQPSENDFWIHVKKEIPDEWELVDGKLTTDNLRLNISRSEESGGATLYSLGSCVITVLVRRSKKKVKESARSSTKKKSSGATKKQKKSVPRTAKNK